MILLIKVIIIIVIIIKIKLIITIIVTITIKCRGKGPHNNQHRAPCDIYNGRKPLTNIKKNSIADTV